MAGMKRAGPALVDESIEVIGGPAFVFELFELEPGPSWDLVPYPDRFDDVMSQTASWTDVVIDLVGPNTGIRYTRTEWGWFNIPGPGGWRKIDPAHPQCWYCGKFVKAGDWWRRMGWTGPCRDCDEPERW